ncbi:hypothetical protein GCM10008932_21570 [Alkalibacterium iburiense]|uniref:Uncharacterized protein n=1 Tax=Alkalibacterium iburiense TaxID=290589 RepID=A0ABP3HGW8_9LACT
MSEVSKVYLSNGLTFLIQASPDSIYQKMTHSDGKSKDQVHEFFLTSGKQIYLHSAHVVAIEEAGSSADHDEGSSEDDRVEQNEEAAKKFKEDLDGNME